MLDLFQPAKRAPGECIIKLGGSEATELYPFLIEVTVDTSRAEAAEAVLTFETRRDVDGAWFVQDDPRVKPWSKIIIEAAFGDENEEVMRGYIREIQLSFPEDGGGALVTVTAQDESLLLDRAHKRRVWEIQGGPMNDGAIAAQIIADANLLPDATPAEGQTLSANQDATDAAFLKERAEANGFELIYREGTIYFGPRRLEGEPQSTIMVYAGAGTNCIQFDIQDDGHLPDAVSLDVAANEGDQTQSKTLLPDLKLLGTEPATSAETLDDGFVWRISKEGESDPDQAETLAQAKANDNAFKVKGTGILDGTLYGHVLKVGLPVGVDGVGTRHSGVWYVDKVQHSFNADGYKQNFELMRNAYGDNLSVSSNPLAAVI